jgi:hypothetical protein
MIMSVHFRRRWRFLHLNSKFPLEDQHPVLPMSARIVQVTSLYHFHFHLFALADEDREKPRDRSPLSPRDAGTELLSGRVRLGPSSVGWVGSDGSVRSLQRANAFALGITATAPKLRPRVPALASRPQRHRPVTCWADRGVVLCSIPRIRLICLPMPGPLRFTLAFVFSFVHTSLTLPFSNSCSACEALRGAQRQGIDLEFATYAFVLKIYESS